MVVIPFLIPFKIKKFIFLSSSVVYPNKPKPMRENDVNFSFFEKYNNVAWMKLYTEKVCEMYNNFFDVLILRPSNLYGPHDKFDKLNAKVIPSLIRKFNNEKKLSKNLNKILKSKKPTICEILMPPMQELIPRVQTQMNKDGTFEPSMIDNMYPFVGIEKLNRIRENLIIIK